MQLTLNISEADFGAELKDIINSLSEDEKKAIAKEVLMKALTEVTDTQRTAHEKEVRVFEAMRNSFYGSDKSMSEDEMRKHYKYAEFMKNMKSAKELAMEEVIKAAIGTFKEHALALVKNDEGLKKAWDETEMQIKADFPKYIHDAMVYYFAGQMGAMQQGIQNALMQSQNAAFSLDSINNRLGNR